MPISPQCPRRCAQYDARGLRYTSPLRGSINGSCAPLGGTHYRGPSYRLYTRGQPREAGSLIRLFSSLETTAKCVSMGPADCRKGVTNSVRFSTTTFQRRDSHTGGPRAGSGYGTRSESPIKEGGHRGGPSSSIEAAGHPILNYIDDWLILAQSEMEAARHRDVILAHMKQLGLN